VSGRKIDVTSAIYTADGILEPLGPMSFRYTPDASLGIEEETVDGGYINADMPSVPNDNKNTTLYGYRRYRVGLDRIRVLKSHPAKVNGFITKEIKVHNCSYLELSASVSGEGNIEYSIIDGLNETPIVPITQTDIIQERIIPGLSTRFGADGNSPVSIYQDGIKTDYGIDDLPNLDYGGGTYTISYKPVLTAYRYKPNNTEVKVKIVQRCMDNKAPATINSIVLLRHGGEKIWTV
jgi:hypothetical protein